MSQSVESEIGYSIQGTSPRVGVYCESIYIAAATLDSKCNTGWSMSWMRLTVQATSQIVIATTYNAREAEMVVCLH